MTVTPVKALSDNYIWVIETGSKAIVVDPGEFDPIHQYLRDNDLELGAILLTHNHDDHTAGVRDLVGDNDHLPIYGPEETSEFANHIVEDGDHFKVLGIEFDVFLTAGHTPGHISFITENDLFCGDALFSAGCGRVFTKDYQAQYEAMKSFDELADQVKVYAGHEYTETNLTFAHQVYPENKQIEEALKEVHDLRAQGKITLPSTMAREREINVFLQAEDFETFKDLRLQRDDM